MTRAIDRVVYDIYRRRRASGCSPNNILAGSSSSYNISRIRIVVITGYTINAVGCCKYARTSIAALSVEQVAVRYRRHCSSLAVIARHGALFVVLTYGQNVLLHHGAQCVSSDG
ncbi:hypothetical protein K0M31_016296 [Melipona bicolor]|uniref:Uncharacterized protein n=1 Tax=Melipona bicolor TaxID=60889 RepID=A0AA40G745_9HYME|nr:hypothetical protein K0M31_016296 [Melipona bicolor]